jgi:enolase-phosphatase E1
MITFTGRGILLDVEGSTSSIKFVYEVLFPFARTHLEDYLRQHWDELPAAQARAQIERDTGKTFPPDVESGLAPLRDEVLRLMDADANATGLKALQGLIWQQGYDAGLLTSHVYPDVPAALQQWVKQGIDVRVYSSGSVGAQRVFFANTTAGDLRPYLRGHYDTTVGAKRDAESYRTIVADMKLSADRVLFLSDVVPELDAAAAAGLRTGLVVRPDNPPVLAPHGHPVVTDFGQIETV